MLYCSLLCGEPEGKPGPVMPVKRLHGVTIKLLIPHLNIRGSDPLADKNGKEQLQQYMSRALHPPPPPPTKILLKEKDVKYFLALGMAATFFIQKTVEK
jgi:hypothetical protein